MFTSPLCIGCLLCCVALVSPARTKISDSVKLEDEDENTASVSPSPAEVLNSESKGKCKPVMLRTECDAKDYRGVLVAFHGFTGCTDQYDELYPRFIANCWDVFAPVLPGHSTAGEMIACKKLWGNKCSVKINGGSTGFNLKELPAHNGSAYKDFADRVRMAAWEELKSRKEQLGAEAEDSSLAAFGLSLGSGIAYRAVVDDPKKWSRVLLANPMLGLGREDADYVLRSCLDKSEGPTDSCGAELREYYLSGFPSIAKSTIEKRLPGDTSAEVQVNMMKFYTSMALDTPRLLKGFILDKSVIWGGACNKIHQHGRNGFCAFQQKHMFGVHAFGLDTLTVRPAGDYFPVMQVMLTETDGISRNGLAYSAAKTVKCAVPNAEVSVCLFPFEKGSGNVGPASTDYWNKTKCVPHASLGSHENKDIKDRWWQPDMDNRIVDFFTNSDSISDKVAFNRDKTKCVDVPLANGALNEAWVKHVVFPQADPEWHECE